MTELKKQVLPKLFKPRMPSPSPPAPTAPVLGVVVLLLLLLLPLLPVAVPREDAVAIDRALAGLEPALDLVAETPAVAAAAARAAYDNWAGDVEVTASTAVSVAVAESAWPTTDAATVASSVACGIAAFVGVVLLSDSELVGTSSGTSSNSDALAARVTHIRNVSETGR
jgi:hypothetical protein